MEWKALQSPFGRGRVLTRKVLVFSLFVLLLPLWLLDLLTQLGKRKVARQRGHAGFQGFLEKLGPEVDPEVARITFLHWQDWVRVVRNFPVMPEDTFEFYGCVGEDVHDECMDVARQCGVNTQAILEELEFTEKWQEYLPVKTVGDSVRLISAWKNSYAVVPLPSMGQEVRRKQKVVGYAVLLLSVAAPLIAWLALGRWSWSVFWLLTGALFSVHMFTSYKLDRRHAQARRHAWDLSRAEGSKYAQDE
jgi:hypothetical protein